MKSNNVNWNSNSKKLIKDLHKEISINEMNWHTYKSNPERRAAELIISALGQIINKGKSEDIQELLTQAIKWLRHEVKDPGCPKN
tara:strand:+ start:219 stop:473 length:255 start_codon:yes stop_codon:yes gene_type:complete